MIVYGILIKHVDIVCWIDGIVLECGGKPPVESKWKVQLTTWVHNGIDEYFFMSMVVHKWHDVQGQ